MNIIITKEVIEEIIGFKILDFKLDPIYEESTCVGLSIQVTPIQSIEEIIINGLINK